MMKRVLILLVGIGLTANVFLWNPQEAVAQSGITVELYYPDIPPDPEYSYPDFFGAGQSILVRGNFPASPTYAYVYLYGYDTEGSWYSSQLATPEYSDKMLVAKIPDDVRTGNFYMYLYVSGSGGGQYYWTTLNVEGVIDVFSMNIEAGLGPEDIQSLAVVSETPLNCYAPGDSQGCYWEAALAGHPDDSNHLAVTGVRSPRTDPQSSTDTVRVSHDGGQSWTAGQLTAVNGGSSYGFDSRAQVSIDEEGRLILSGQIRDLSTNDVGVSVFSGPVTGDAFSRNGPPLVDPGLDANFSDYVPKLARHADSGTVYVSARAVKTGEDGGSPVRENILYVSTDDGATFTPHNIDAAFAEGMNIWAVRSMDTAPDGSLRAVVLARTADAPFPESQLFIVKFDVANGFNVVEAKKESDNTNFEILVGGPSGFVGVPWARFVSTSNRGWFVWVGPQIVIPKHATTAHPGRIYMLWAEPESMGAGNFQFNNYGINYDVYLAYSDDDGAHWSSPLQINDDAASADQVFPRMSIDTEDNIHVTFLDKRDAPTRAEYDVFYARIHQGQVGLNRRVNSETVPQNTRDGRSPGFYLDNIVGYPDAVYIAYPCGVDALSATDACVAKIDPHFDPPDFLRGDVNMDGSYDIADPVLLLIHLFVDNPPEILCADAADVDDDGILTVKDAIYILESMFLAGPMPAYPFPQPGEDLTEDELGCEQGGVVVKALNIEADDCERAENFEGIMPQCYTRGDANDDGAVDQADADCILHYLFYGTCDIACLEAGDVNADGKVDISDSQALLSHLFLGNFNIPAPAYPDQELCPQQMP